MITIVGAGLVGSLWAIFLCKKGYKVQVFEKRSDPRLQKSSAGRSINLVVTSRGLNALEQAGLLQEVKTLAVPVYGRMIHSLTGETTYQPYGQDDECNYSISRDSLNRFLITQAEKAGATFFFEHQLQRLNVEKKQAVFTTSSGSYLASYEILFGADGAGSRVRKQLATLYPTLFHEKTEWIEADYKELTLPIGSDDKAQLQKHSLHIWPRGDSMMMALANLDKSFTVTLYLPKERFALLTSSEKITDLFQKEFPDALPLMPSAVSEFLENPQGNLGTVRCSRWVFDDSIALIGDAAHAIVPFFGQGMNCGFEDCTILNSLLKPNSTKNSINWAQILREYEKAQKPNAQAISDMALENWLEMRDQVADIKFLFRKKLENELEKKYPNSYKSRYGLITYTLVPYALAQKAGELQQLILDELTVDGISTLNDISWQKADLLISQHWQRFLAEHKIDVKRYVPSFPEKTEILERLS
ncbi:MAG: FAD-dependent oxidoreductase [Gammaproteobacteria bacterium]